jgi:hypothetical protein
MFVGVFTKMVSDGLIFICIIYNNDHHKQATGIKDATFGCHDYQGL